MKAKSFQRVSSLEEAYKLVKESPRNKIVAGGLWLKKGGADVDTLIDLSLLGLNKIEDKKDYVEVGAMVTQREFEQSKLVPEMAREAVKAIMGPGFRNVATIGGSVYGEVLYRLSRKFYGVDEAPWYKQIGAFGEQGCYPNGKVV